MIDPKEFLCTNSHKFSNQKIRHAPKETKDSIIQETSFFPEDTPLLIRLIALRDGYSHSNLPVCESCGSLVNRTNEGRLLRFCNSKCYSQSEQFKNSLKNVDHEKANEVRKKTMKEKYGVEFNSQRDEVKPILGAHCSTPEFKEKARERGYQQYSHINRDLYTPEHIAQLNQTNNLPEIADIMGCSPSHVFQSLKKLGLHAKIHNHSREETKLKKFLLENKINFKTNDRSVIAPQELDFYLPDNQLAIELNGVFWHSELQGKDKLYHLKKTQECESKGVQLLHFWDIELNKKWDLISSLILSKCNLLEKKIGARETTVKSVEIKEEREFLDQNHIQGYRPSKICLGLYHENELVSLMSFGKSRFNKTVDWELLRFCSLKGVQVIGGASRLFSQHPQGSIISYADRRYSMGQLYDKLGFTKVGTGGPSYFYFNDRETIHNRIKFQKHKLELLLDSFDPNLTEWENMKNNGYDRVWDCGTLVYMFKE